MQLEYRAKDLDLNEVLKTAEYHLVMPLSDYLALSRSERNELDGLFSVFYLTMRNQPNPITDPAHEWLGFIYASGYSRWLGTTWSVYASNGVVIDISPAMFDLIDVYLQFRDYDSEIAVLRARQVRQQELL